MSADAERMVDELAQNSRPDEVEKVDRQFAEKLARLEQDGSLKPESLDQLRRLWQVMRDDDPKIPWSARALAMAALAYLVAPLDAIPDAAGKLGHKDDAVVIGICYRRVETILGPPPPA